MKTSDVLFVVGVVIIPVALAMFFGVSAVLDYTHQELWPQLVNNEVPPAHFLLAADQPDDRPTSTTARRSSRALTSTRI